LTDFAGRRPQFPHTWVSRRLPGGVTGRLARDKDLHVTKDDMSVYWTAVRSRTPVLALTFVWTTVLAGPSPAVLLAGQPPAVTDWLIDGSDFVAGFAAVSGQPDVYRLSNGLVQRTFLLRDAVAASIGLSNLRSGQQLVRAVRPEAVVTIDGQRFDVGGLTGQPNHAFLKPEWLARMKPSENALRWVGYTVGEPQPRFAWKRVRHAAPGSTWPPSGIRLTLEFRPPAGFEPEDAFRVRVHYELYDGVPVFCKWISVENRGDRPLTIDHFAAEILAVVEQDSRVESRPGVPVPAPDSIHVETDFAFGGFTSGNANRHIVHWRKDPEYLTQVNYKRETPCLLMVEPEYGPAQTVLPEASFVSCRSFQLLHDSTERERRSLAVRRMYRTIAPWVTENPLMHHLRVSAPVEVRRAIDDAASVGFEMVILSFGSGFDIEDDSDENLQKWKKIAEYGRQRGVEVGGYSLLSSRRIGDGNDIVSPPGQRPTHGHCPALTSPWGQAYYRKLYRFFEFTGFAMLEHDGPWPGDVDVTPRPPLQQGEADSRWVQAGIANGFYRWCRGRGIYVNAPDYYYLNGTNKCGMGYREVNWSLPRDMQVIHTRQNIYDGTWHKTPSMGWMFVPLSEYHGGGAAATIEPLDEHRDHYRRMLQSNLGLGVQACYRGPRLFDTQRTRQMVREQVDWFRQYRDILESDVVHGRRADGRDVDWMLHVNPDLPCKGMLLVYNPADRPVQRTLEVDLYYTGLADNAVVSERDERPQRMQLQRDYRIRLPVSVPPRGMNWFVIRE
jgi:hypothetical protein